MRNDGKYDTCYQHPCNLVGPPVSRSGKKHNYRKVYYQVIDTIRGMLIERFQDRTSFEFLDLINGKHFRTWEGKVPSISVGDSVYTYLYYKLIFPLPLVS